MTIEEIKNSISYCGLLCCLCSTDGSCNCRLRNQCSKKMSPEGCYQYDCCIQHGYNGCWECPDMPCGKDMLNEQHIRLITFIKCIREDGIDKFAASILRNYKNGIKYHRDGYTGDYDLDTEEEILNLLRYGK